MTQSALEQLKEKITGLDFLYAKIAEKPYGSEVTMARKTYQEIKTLANLERKRLTTEAKKAKAAK